MVCHIVPDYQVIAKFTGVEFPAFPEILKANGSIVVADMSSNILSRKIPFEHFSAVFFGAQKNLGSAGITVVAIRKSILGDLGDDFKAAKPKETPSAQQLRSLGLGGAIPPKVFSYHTCAANGSLYNTLSILE
jgi:phosphoserine aminotransferase